MKNKKNRSLLNHLTMVSIDRMAEKRRDKKWLEEQLQNPSTRLLPMWQDRHLVKETDDGKHHALLLSPEEARKTIPQIKPDIFLGKDRETGTVYFAADLPTEKNEAAETLETLGEFMDLRWSVERVNRFEGALLAYARAIAYWHHNHAFCGSCGHPTRLQEAGFLRVCTHKDCQKEHYPRTDPAVIALITDGQRCLLGSAPRWPKGLYSTIAGFVEPGETFEQAVAREGEEETGVRIDPERVFYHSSQPWPFPASIMIGFTAYTEHQQVRVDPEELEDARWFSREEIQQELDAGTIRLPSAFSIANRLISDWRRG